ncbi:unnamed protein product [Withania somnifera]
MSQNSYSSQMKCSCGLVVKSLISSTPSNPGRRFFGCPRLDSSSCGYWEWEDQVFTKIAYIRNLELSLKDVKSEVDNLKFEMENLKIAMDNLKIQNDNLKIEGGNLSERDSILEDTNDELEVNKVRTFEEKYFKIKYNLMISWALFIGFVVVLMNNVTLDK